MNYTEWLNGLKVGDEVYVEGHYSRGICKIEKISPMRQITVSKMVFKDGYCKPKMKWDFGFKILPVTDEVKKQIKESNTRDKFKRLCDKMTMMSSKVSIEDADAVINILSKYMEG